MKKSQNTSWKRFKPVENLENFNETKVSGSQNIYCKHNKYTKQ